MICALFTGLTSREGIFMPVFLNKAFYFSYNNEDKARKIIKIKGVRAWQRRKKQKKSSIRMRS